MKKRGNKIIVLITATLTFGALIAASGKYIHHEEHHYSEGQHCFSEPDQEQAIQTE